jgi:hypothetical protein
MSVTERFRSVLGRRPAAQQGDAQDFVAADASAPAEALRAQMDERGYVFFPGLLPRDAVLEARAEALALCRDAGWIDPGADRLEARFSGHAPEADAADPEYRAFYALWIESPAFNALPEHPALFHAAGKLLGEDVMVHRRKIGRVGFPQNEGRQTPAHQDFFHVRGTTETFTAWVPLGDCPRRLGSLSVAEGTHKLGFQEHTPSEGVGGYSVDADDEARWRTHDYNVGDVIFFHSLTMHKALPNRSADEVRVSLDNRYQRASDDIDPGSLEPHTA